MSLNKIFTDSNLRPRINATFNELNANSFITSDLVVNNLNVDSLTASDITTDNLNSSNIVATDITADSLISSEIYADTIDATDMTLMNLDVIGTANIQDANISNLNVVSQIETSDNLITLGLGNPSDVIDMGTLFKYDNGNDVASGIYRSADDGFFRIFEDSQQVNISSSLVIDRNATGYKMGTLVGNVNSNLINSSDINAGITNTNIINASDVNSITFDGQIVNTTDMNSENVNCNIINTSDINTITVDAHIVNATDISTVNSNSTIINTNIINASDVNTITMDSHIINTTDMTTVNSNSTNIFTNNINSTDITTLNSNSTNIFTNNINATDINVSSFDAHNINCTDIDTVNIECSSSSIFRDTVNIAPVDGVAQPALEIGRIDGSTSQPYIDFHANPAPIDYDARIQCIDPNGAIGGGEIEATCRIFKASNTLNIGSATEPSGNVVLRVRGGNLQTGAQVVLEPTTFAGSSRSGINFIHKDGSKGIQLEYDTNGAGNDAIGFYSFQKAGYALTVDGDDADTAIDVTNGGIRFSTNQNISSNRLHKRSGNGLYWGNSRLDGSGGSYTLFSTNYTVSQADNNNILVFNSDNVSDKFLALPAANANEGLRFRVQFNAQISARLFIQVSGSDAFPVNPTNLFLGTITTYQPTGINNNYLSAGGSIATQLECASNIERGSYIDFIILPFGTTGSYGTQFHAVIMNDAGGITPSDW